MPMDRIYFEQNAGDSRGRCDLDIPDAQRDLKPLADTLHDSVRVRLYDGQDSEIEAVLAFDHAANRWMALPIWSTVCRLSNSHSLSDVTE
jgi:hypothetical protein